ncbi:MAG: RcnB family protein [Xanthomonadales bacterium]|nr:RcnB family protein [Xanthomonadales bacterium]
MNTLIHFTLALALFGASAAVDAQAQAGEPQVPTRHERQHLGHGYDPGAQPHPYRSQRYSRHPDQYGYWDHRRYRSTQPQDHGFRMRHRPDGNNEEQARRRFQSPGLYAPPPGYYPYHWSRGQHLPRDWYGLAYRLDHHAYGLLAPPPGHHWVRVDNDVFMVALDSGLIVDGVHDLFH